MTNATLRAQLEAFAADAATCLTQAVREGDEVPFDVIEASARGASLYCYRPLTGDFIRARLGLLVALDSYAPAAQALEFSHGVEGYLRSRGEGRIPDGARERADAALRCFLARVFAERSHFHVDPERFAGAYAELEHCLSDGLAITEVVAPLHGLALDGATRELALATGLTIIRQELLEEPPAGLVDGMSRGDLLVLVRIPQPRAARPALAEARLRLGQLTTALRLYERGSFSIGPLAFHRAGPGAWTPAVLGTTARAGLPVRVGVGQEDELRAFVNLIARRLESIGAEIAWALQRFEFGVEREEPALCLSDHLLALRALLEPEGTASGRLAQRLSVICAAPEERAALAERTARAIALETAIISGGGRPPMPERGEVPAEALTEEMSDHLRAILRDVLCGHLESDVRLIADDLLAEAAAEV